MTGGNVIQIIAAGFTISALVSVCVGKVLAFNDEHAPSEPLQGDFPHVPPAARLLPLASSEDWTGDGFGPPVHFYSVNKNNHEGGGKQ